MSDLLILDFSSSFIVVHSWSRSVLLLPLLDGCSIRAGRMTHKRRVCDERGKWRRKRERQREREWSKNVRCTCVRCVCACFVIFGCARARSFYYWIFSGCWFSSFGLLRMIQPYRLLAPLSLSVCVFVIRIYITGTASAFWSNMVFLFCIVAADESIMHNKWTHERFRKRADLCLFFLSGVCLLVISTMRITISHFIYT